MHNFWGPPKFCCWFLVNVKLVKPFHKSVFWGAILNGMLPPNKICRSGFPGSYKKTSGKPFLLQPGFRMDTAPSLGAPLRFTLGDRMEKVVPYFFKLKPINLDVSKNKGTPKSSILIGFSFINYPFLGTPILGNPSIFLGGWDSKVRQVWFLWNITEHHFERSLKSDLHNSCPHILSHRIHIYGVFTYIYHTNELKCSLNVPYMDPKGMVICWKNS